MAGGRVWGRASERAACYNGLQTRLRLSVCSGAIGYIHTFCNHAKLFTPIGKATVNPPTLLRHRFLSLNLRMDMQDESTSAKASNELAGMAVIRSGTPVGTRACLPSVSDRRAADGIIARRLLVSVCGLLILLLAAAAPPSARAEQFSGMSYIDNGTVRVGVNLDIGGAITYVSPSNSEENIINSHDWGRQVQMSFYSGPTPFIPHGKQPSPTWRFLGWNPIQAGDCYGHGSKVIAHQNDGKTLYVKCIPMQWPLNNEPGECTFETWIRLEGNTAQVRSQINNARSDKTQYPARGQELPAVYTNGNYYRLFTYAGDEPFTGEQLRQITKVWRSGAPDQVEGGPWDHWYATENWAAWCGTTISAWAFGRPGPTRSWADLLASRARAARGRANRLHCSHPLGDPRPQYPVRLPTMC